MAIKLATTERKLIEAERAGLTDVVTSRVDELVAQWFGLMQGLAGSDNLVKGQFADFEREARQLLARSELTSISVFSRKGDLLITTGLTAVRADHSLPADLVERIFSGMQAATPLPG